MSTKPWAGSCSALSRATSEISCVLRQQGKRSAVEIDGERLVKSVLRGAMMSANGG